MRHAFLVAALGLLMAMPSARAADDPFAAWEHETAGRAGDVHAFELFLKRQGVAGILPTSQLLLDASSWRACGEEPYSLPPRELWANVVPTLRFIRQHVVPALGPVAAVSGYRSPELNACAGGAPKSAHALYYALDLTPLEVTDRNKMIAEVCQIHARYGAAAHVGLGFYSGLRFHVDTHGYRLWGTDYHAATSPCVTLQASR
jgi:hypothetical protein